MFSTWGRPPRRCAPGPKLDPPDFTQMRDSEGFDLIVPVRITDRAGNEVVHADITTWVTPAG